MRSLDEFDNFDEKRMIGVQYDRGVRTETYHRVFDLRPRVGGLKLVANMQRLAGREDFEPFFHTAVDGIDVHIAALRKRPISKAKGVERCRTEPP